jgi:UDP-N-acetylmuramoyl-tripeptide--D-alanyl-D-alanine ligase
MRKQIWTNKQLEESLAINLPGDNYYGAVRFNSQSVEEGDIFIALTGGVGDGHRFVRDALNKGASLAIISSNSGLEHIDSTKLLLVDDTYKTLDKLAIYKRSNFHGKVIAITGSVGKTTTKKMIQSMLELYGKTHANFGNFNNNIGVRLTLASLPEDTEYLIIEMGMNQAGEIDELSKIAKPDIAAITRIGESHIGHFSSIDEIIDAKCEIFNHLNPKDSIAILNSSDDSFSRCYQKLIERKIKNIHSFGSMAIDEVKILNSKRLINNCFALHIKTKQQKIKVVTNVIPEHFIENFLCALAIINALSLPIELATSIISQFEPEIGRGKIVQSQILGKKFAIICDFYNSGPPSLSAALINLSALHNPNKVAILGDMKELGQFETELHKKMVSYIHAAGVKKLFLVGSAMSNIAQYIDPKIEVHKFATVEELQSQILNFLQGGELILIKASRSIKLEKVAITLGVNYII